MNEAHGLLDALLYTAVEGASDTPPAAPAEGEEWLITATAQGEWAGKEDNVAAYVGSRWIFAAPQPGMHLYLKNSAQHAFFSTSWASAIEPVVPTGGTTVDTEARNAIIGLIDALRTAGILAQV